MKVSDVVVDNPLSTRIFNERGIDFCCQGRDTLLSACSRKSIEIDNLLTELGQLERGPLVFNPESDPQASDIIEYIIERFHKELKHEIPVLKFLMEKVCRVHGPGNNYLYRLEELTNTLLSDLEVHMMKEEQILFPLINQLQQDSGKNEHSGFGHCGHIRNPIGQMEHEHVEAGNILKEMNELTGGYTLPENSCNSFRGLYAGLVKLETDLKLHIHFENNILHPLALKLNS